MKSRVIAILGVAATMLVVATSLFFATRQPAKDANELPSPLIGHVAPAIAGTTLRGQSFNLADYRGQLIVVNFWASWCGPCKSEGPELSTLAWEQQQTHGATVVGVVFNDSTSAARDFEKNYGSLYTSVIDTKGEIANAYGVTSPPVTYIIDRSGHIAAAFLGETTSSQLTAALNGIGT
ncbi:MAG: TlpA disulfide reductase family protein [Actinomycetes bacterium]